MISGPTIEKMIIRLGAIHRFAYKRGYTTVDPARTEVPAVSGAADRIDREDKPFSTRELQAIFSGYLYAGTDTGSAELVFPYQFWLPLLALFTGGRLNELCQLESTDVRQEEETGIFFIRIANEGTKSLKNHHSRRAIPLHDDLIRIGFLDFVAQAKNEGREKLFRMDSPTNQRRAGAGLPRHSLRGCRAQARSMAGTSIPSVSASALLMGSLMAKTPCLQAHLCRSSAQYQRRGGTADPGFHWPRSQEQESVR